MKALAVFAALALAAPAAHTQVTWKAPVTYTGNGFTFTAATLPGAQVMTQGITAPVFNLPPPNAPGLPLVPQLACFEADGPGGLMIKAPPGSWMGVQDNGGVVTLLEDGNGCIWTDRKYWHLR